MNSFVVLKKEHGQFLNRFEISNPIWPKKCQFFRYVWPWARGNSIAHDSYHCRQYPYTRPFPTKRVQDHNNFVAAVVAEGNILKTVCPEVCRPLNHTDWRYCWKSFTFNSQTIVRFIRTKFIHLFCRWKLIRVLLLLEYKLCYC